MKLPYNYKAGGGDASCCGGHKSANVCDPRKIKSIVKSGDNVLIVLDDCTYLEAPFDVVDVSVKQPVEVVNPEQMRRLEAVEARMKALTDAIVSVNKFGGDEVYFKAIDKTFGES